MINLQINVNQKQSVMINLGGPLLNLNALVILKCSMCTRPEIESEGESNQKLLKLPLVFSSPISHYFGYWKDMLRPCLQRGTQVGSLIGFVHTQMKKMSPYEILMTHVWAQCEVPVTIDHVCHGNEMVCISWTQRFYYRQSYTRLQWQWDWTDFTWSKDYS